MSDNAHVNKISSSDEKTNKKKQTKRRLFLKKAKETSKATFLKVYKGLKLDKVPRLGTFRAGLGTGLGTLRDRLGTRLVTLRDRLWTLRARLFKSRTKKEDSNK